MRMLRVYLVWTCGRLHGSLTVSSLASSLASLSDRSDCGHSTVRRQYQCPQFWLSVDSDVNRCCPVFREGPCSGPLLADPRTHHGGVRQPPCLHPRWAARTSHRGAAPTGLVSMGYIWEGCYRGSKYPCRTFPRPKQPSYNCLIHFYERWLYPDSFWKDALKLHIQSRKISLM